MLLFLPPLNQSCLASNQVVEICLNTDFWLVKITREACYTRDLNVGTWVVKRAQERDNYLLTRNITFPLLLQHYVTKQVALLCCPFYCSFSYSVTKRVQITKSYKLIIEYFQKTRSRGNKIRCVTKTLATFMCYPKSPIKSSNFVVAPGTNCTRSFRILLVNRLGSDYRTLGTLQNLL